MNNKTILKIAISFLFLASSTNELAAHPMGNLPAVEVTTAADANASMSFDAQKFEYYFDLFTKILYESPTENQQQLIDQVKDTYVVLQPWGDKAKSPAIAAANDEVYRQMRAYFTIISLVWENNDIRLRSSVPPIDVAGGLPRPVLIEVTNETEKPVKMEIFAGKQKSAYAGPTIIEHDHLRAMLVSLYDDNVYNGSLRLSFVPDGNTAGARFATLAVHVVKPATIRGTIYDADTGKIQAGRVYVKGGDNILRHAKEFADNKTLSEKPIVLNIQIANKWHTLPFFYSDGHFEVNVPPGPVAVTLERGYEYGLATAKLNAEPGKTYDVEVRSGRFIDMKKLGWISGDTHVHWVKNWWSENEDIKLLSMVQQAEDLRVANNLTLLQYRPSPEGTFIAPSQYPMGPVPGYCGNDYYIQMAEEYRNDNFYGHVNFLNIKKLIEPISTGAGSGGPAEALDYPLNKTAIEQCHTQGGISIEAHNLGPFNCSDVIANVMSGISDSLDQLEPVYYYRFLDCGIRVPLTNGSDHPARVTGCCRAYVKIDGEFTYQKWINGIMAKRTFTTSGPLLFLEVNGVGIGDELKAKQGNTLRIKARVLSRHPVGNFQIVSNGGEILSETKVSGDRAEMTFQLPADRSRWFVARCSQTDMYSALDRPDIAHTSAVYVVVDNKPILNADAPAFWAGLLRRHIDNVSKNGHYANDTQRQEELTYLRSALEKYEHISQESSHAK